MVVSVVATAEWGSCDCVQRSHGDGRLFQHVSVQTDVSASLLQGCEERVSYGIQRQHWSQGNR